jgi:asparagine synthase (glutamine-hydrolysing)
MCGIAGEIDFNNNRTDIKTFENIKKTLKRRGPDQDGIYRDDYVTLVHTRLSVIDLEKGRQPMKTKYKLNDYCIVYNGELYNTDEVRSSLRNNGYDFESHSDTEVILKAYIEWGQDCVLHFNGIFAFAVWDKTLKKLFIARDRMGVKPFFYCIKNNKFIFSSEIKGILAHPDIDAVIDINSVAEIILIGPGRTPGYGIFKGIYELKAGYCGYYSEKGLELSQYFKIEDKEFKDNLNQTVEKVRYLVTDAIEKQLVSDVEICTFLSGGLDSSIISALSEKHLKNKGIKLTTYSVHYIDNEKYFKPDKFQPNSDDYYINVMSDYIKSNHIKIYINNDELINALFDAVDARDLPGMADVDSSLLLFCKRVKEKATVALSGECADEIFGGYPWYRDEKIRNSDGFPWAQNTSYRYAFLKEEIKDIINAENYVNERYLDTVRNTSKAEGLNTLESRMKEMTMLNINWFMQTLLDRKDRMSMYNGLEVRVPFCDHRITEYLYTVPWEIKNLENREKGLLRKAMEGLLPDEILWRKKSPYPKTHNPKYFERLSLLLKNLIDEGNSPMFNIIDKRQLNKLLKEENKTPWYGQLMKVPQTVAYFLQIDYWLCKYNVKIDL